MQAATTWGRSLCVDRICIAFLSTAPIFAAQKTPNPRCIRNEVKILFTDNFVQRLLRTHRSGLDVEASKPALPGHLCGGSRASDTVGKWPSERARWPDGPMSEALGNLPALFRCPRRLLKAVHAVLIVTRPSPGRSGGFAMSAKAPARSDFQPDDSIPDRERSPGRPDPPHNRKERTGTATLPTGGGVWRWGAPGIPGPPAAPQAPSSRVTSANGRWTCESAEHEKYLRPI